jgi:fermentation-respiration switch protein FrsA (DUF1100 family)
VAAVTHDKANRFMYFPGDYRWSAAFDLVLGSAPFGGADMGELDRAGRPLLDRVGDDEAWFAEWRALGDRVRSMAGEAEAAGHRFTAASDYLRACSYYQTGERFRTPKDQPALDAYRTAVECFHRYAALTTRPRIEVVEVPYEGDSLPAYFVQAENTDVARRPCVVFFDGLDITKELQYLRGVPELVRRGLSCLIVDGPGNGESIRFRGRYLRPEWEVPGAAALDYLATRPDVDSDRVGVLGISLGGYYAPRAAALEPRFAACVAWGAQWDYHAVWKRRVEAGFRTSLSVPGHHITWVLGVNSLDEALDKLQAYRLDSVVQRMRCPFLLTHGEDDSQIPMEDAHALYEAVGSADKTLRVFTLAEGGHQHCQNDYLTHGSSVIWDWFSDKLGADR